MARNFAEKKGNELGVFFFFAAEAPVNHSPRKHSAFAGAGAFVSKWPNRKRQSMRSPKEIGSLLCMEIHYRAKRKTLDVPPVTF